MAARVVDVDRAVDLAMLVVRADLHERALLRGRLHRVVREVAVSVAEMVAVADRVAVLPPIQIDVGEPVAATDRVGVLPPISIAVHESIAVTDIVTVTPP